MVTAAVKLLPLLVSWGVIVLFLARGSSGRGVVLTACTVAGFLAGVAGASVLVAATPPEVAFTLVKGGVASCFLLTWGWSMTALYRATGGSQMLPAAQPAAAVILSAVAVSVLAGALSAFRLAPPGTAVPLAATTALLLIAIIVALAAIRFEPRLPALLAVTPASVSTLLVSALLFMASTMPRMDLFSPLSMQVMKFIHDFVHQFFESMLIPDHPFFRGDVWGTIGLLFGKEVGFWGGMVLWFLPALMVAGALRLERLPSVAHLRQGAQRRLVLAGFIRARRSRLLLPLVSVAFLAAGVYQSRFPAIEYWNPKPLPVTAQPSGEILIPLKGEVDLEDGRIHKFVFSQGGREARFFILQAPDGRLTATLDACAICKPDGYGQGEGTVICYYCVTLIPLETVGKPGGCNPVPVSSTRKGESLAIDALTLLNLWSETVQATTRIEGGGR